MTHVCPEANGIVIQLVSTVAIRCGSFFHALPLTCSRKVITLTSTQAQPTQTDSTPAQSPLPSAAFKFKPSPRAVAFMLVPNPCPTSRWSRFAPLIRFLLQGCNTTQRKKRTPSRDDNWKMTQGPNLLSFYSLNMTCVLANWALEDKRNKNLMRLWKKHVKSYFSNWGKPLWTRLCHFSLGELWTSLGTSDRWRRAIDRP